VIYDTLINASDLSLHLDDPDWVIVDSRFMLAKPEQGQIEYTNAHIPGSVYAHLDADLSGPIISGVTGRHPLPSIGKATDVFSRLGIGPGVQVVAYDDMYGALAAGRVWWLLRWLGHEAVAVLDGGWQEWIKNGLPVRSGVESRSSCGFIAHPRNDMTVTVEDVDAMRQNPEYWVLDARSADRFRGENETIDPIPGHIPGAISAPYAANLTPDGIFLDKNELASRYRKLLGDVPAQKVVCYCGSGVTSTHDILAMMVAGLGEARLYPGSYSEWITDPKRPVDK